MNKVKIINHNIPRNYSFVLICDINNDIRLQIPRPNIETKISDYWMNLRTSQHYNFLKAFIKYVDSCSN